MISYLSEKTRGLSATWSAGRDKKSFDFSTLLVNINVIFFFRHDMLRSPTVSADNHTSVNVKNSSSAFINSYNNKTDIINNCLCVAHFVLPLLEM